MSGMLKPYMAPIVDRFSRRAGSGDDLDGGHHEHESVVVTFFFVALLLGCFVRFGLEVRVLCNSFAMQQQCYVTAQSAILQASTDFSLGSPAAVAITD
eukprot:1440698-Rhodomonas_salina.1